jgi:uncharacterized RDD family membrane protein YckC
MDYAGFWIRLVAYLIDGIILWFLNLFLAGILRLGAFLAKPSPTELELTSFILGMFIGIAYWVGFWTWRGQTPGKMALGLKIIRADGSPLSLGQAFLRYLGYIVSALILYIGFLWIAFDGRKQGIHDKIADTYVIRLSPRQ